ncbi:hypothetical protein Dsin_012824 [Dipteronia sinensis]|uniref:MYND-type domain-containing protein n=1 Tax=Dipteronia sinensis TaxID=43782 RepID=A0AAE0AK07_9ROSI|nr:hypothetical protein Dsin_012824 [Dipteronia sinensis]
MLEPREADVPALFLVLVVLPLVAYILLGKWSEVAKKRERSQRTSLLAHLAAEESIKAETLAMASVIPLVSTSKSGVYVCARCFAPSKTRCSGCKSVRYCSGRCQIIHWREVHKQECQQLETTSSSSSPMDASVEAEESLKKHNFISSRSSSGSSSSSYSAKYGANAHENDKLLKCKFDDEIVECNCHPERAAVNGSINAKIAPNPPGTRFSNLQHHA